MAKDINVAWAAGLFEGEGTTFLTKPRMRGQTAYSRQCVVALVMTDEDIVRRFAVVVGVGSVHVRSKRPPRKTAYQWTVSDAADVLHVLGLLWPYLGERRQERAAEVMEHAATLVEHRGFCKRGHDLSDPQHLYVHKKTGKRHCRTCRIEGSRRRRVPRLAT